MIYKIDFFSLFLGFIFCFYGIFLVSPENSQIQKNEIKVWNGYKFETCNCNNKAVRCYFNEKLFEKTGHGGHCIDCIDNTDGPNCEKCKEGYFFNQSGTCVACNCNNIGSLSAQCNDKGQCQCKSGVDGLKCDKCQVNYYDFSEQGCRLCGCSKSGSFNNTPSCNLKTGECRCKDNVDGKRCNNCKAGYFNLELDNPFGCLPCFCFGHSSICKSASNYFKYNHESYFTYDLENWTAYDKFNNQVEPKFDKNGIILEISNQDISYFTAPEKFLGDQKASYNQFLSFNLKLEKENFQPEGEDIVLEGSGIKIFQPINGQRNPSPSTRKQFYRFRISENFHYGWKPKISFKSFMHLLSNLTALKIRGVYGVNNFGSISHVRLESARQLEYNQRANWIETCDCPPGYSGQHCEACSPGYKRDPLGKGPFVGCIPCKCDRFASHCDPVSENCKECQCDLIGIQSDQPFFISYKGRLQEKGLTSFCNSSSEECNCKPYVTGHACDKCMDGYWGISHSEGCQRCDCDYIGSLNSTCDQFTGQCLCKPGVIGKKCDKCQLFYYGFSEKGCQKCDCNSSGSRSPQCREDGQCECHSNVEGRKCERCRENTYATDSGCSDCHPCYGLVQDMVNAHRLKLNDLRHLLEEIQDNPNAVEDVDFENQLRDAIARVTNLWNEAKMIGEDTLATQLENLKNRISKVQETTDEINGRLNEISPLIAYGTQNISLAENIAKRAEDALLSVQSLLKGDGLLALQKAREKASLFGQQSVRMSQIAQEARMLAKSHEDQAEAIESVLKNALNSSSEAYKLIKDAIILQKSNKDAIRAIRKQLNDTSELMERTRKMSQEAKREAIRAYDDSLAIFTDASQMLIPDLDSDRIRQNAIDLMEQAKRIMKEADNLLVQYDNLLNNTKYRTDEANDLLQETARQQKNAEFLLIEADLALQKARDAVTAGDATLKEATATRNTLAQFDEVIKRSQAKAEEAFKKIPELENLIREAQIKTDEAEKALRGAEANAFEAKDIAVEAKVNAEKASQNANRISAAAKTTREKARKAKESVSRLLDNIKSTERRIGEFEQQADNDEKLAGEALEKATQAKTSAEDAKNKVELALRIVNTIIYDLEHLEDIDANLLDELERRLLEAEKEMKEANLENQTEILSIARDEQAKLMHEYEYEIDKLVKDVANIRQISETIPQQCFRRIRLEP